MGLFKPRVQKDYEERIEALDKREEAFEDRVEAYDREITRDNEDKDYSDGLVHKYNSLQDEIEESDGILCGINREIGDANKSCGRAKDHAFQITQEAKKEATQIKEEAKTVASFVRSEATTVAKEVEAKSAVELRATKAGHVEAIKAHQETIKSLMGVIQSVTGKLPNVDLDSIQVINTLPQQKQSKKRD